MLAQYILRGALLVCLLPAAAETQQIQGLYDGTAMITDALRVPVHIEFIPNNNHFQARFLNGQESTPSTSGEVNGNEVSVHFAQYAMTLRLTQENGVLRGIYQRDNSSAPVQLELRPRSTNPSSVQTSSTAVPHIAGSWTIPIDGPQGEHAWHLIVEQTGNDVSASILRIYGDTGYLTGTYREGVFRLGYFGDSRAAYLEIQPKQDGTLALLEYDHVWPGSKVDGERLIALPESDPRSQQAEALDKAAPHTRVLNNDELVRFRFPNVKGTVVSDKDVQFKDKVILLNITGSWCPICHDEAPFLEELYQKYHSHGLEIVALDFEDADQLRSLSRLRAFIQKDNLSYTYLVAGETSEAGEDLARALGLTPGNSTPKVSGASGLNIWPTTFFIGRDRRVHDVEVGFPSSASAGFHDEAKRKYVATVEALLKQKEGDH